MELVFGKEGEKLVKLYQETLKISLDEARLIISKNKTAQQLLSEEPALQYTGTDTNLSALLGATLLRDFYDFEPIREKEKEIVKKHYNFEII